MQGGLKFKRFLPWAVILVALAVTAVTSWSYVARGDDRNGLAFCDLPEGCESPAYERTPRSADEELARKHAPIVYLPRQTGVCDAAGSAIKPVPVDIILDNPEIVLRKQGEDGFAIYGPTATDLANEGKEYFDAYIDMPGNPRRATCKYQLDAARYAENFPNIAYARVVEQDDTVIVQYWMFYYFNNWNNKHEADWELVQLTFDASSAQRALQEQPETISLSQHSTGETAKWTDAKVHHEGDRPLIFVAAGSHANYFAPRVYMGLGEGGEGVGCDDASASIERTPLNAVLLPKTVTSANDPFAWLTFKGYWGEQAGPEYDGASNPVTKQNWLKPLAWENRLREGSTTVPLRNTIGPNAIGAFCDMISFGADSILPWYRTQPAMLVAALGLVSAGGLVGLTRTRYLPVRGLPLRSRRRMGQLLLTAATIYRRKALAFIGIGLAVIPLGLLAPEFGWPLDLSLPFNLYGPLDNEIQGVARTLVQVELRFGLAYLAIIWASTTVIARLERGEPTGAAEGLSDLARYLPQLLMARLLTMAVMVLLTLTIVGAPVAVWLAVRWAFAEQAVILDGQPAMPALRTSSLLTSRDWWWSAAAVVGLGFAGFVAASTVGVGAILFLKSMPLVYINLATSIVFVAVVPFVAIAMSLAYFDLQARRS
jgi:hypothetical protein